MELSEYISLTLSEIAKGVKAYEGMGEGYILTETQMEIGGIPVAKQGYSRKPIINVGFRVSVEVEDSRKINGKLAGSLKVVSANTDITKMDGTKSIHEITFQLPLILPQ